MIDSLDTLVLNKKIDLFNRCVSNTNMNSTLEDNSISIEKTRKIEEDGCKKENYSKLNDIKEELNKSIKYIKDKYYLSGNMEIK